MTDEPFPLSARRKSRPVHVGDVQVGGDAPVVVQTMTNTDTADANATIEQIDIARKVLGEQNLASVQNQFSPAFRSSEDELAHCAELGIAFLPYSPLGGIGRAARLGSRHAAFQQVAEARRVSPQQVALAWMLAKAPVVIPIPGASRPESITDSAQAADLTLTPAELATLDQS